LKNKLKEIWEELKSVLSGSTIDALMPPILFAIVNGLFGLEAAVISALCLTVLLGVIRVVRGQIWGYALGGVLGVSLAAGLALLTQQAASYFIPAIITSALLVLAALISNLVGKPLAAWVSHLTRGWHLDWFWRVDVKPAYREVTWFWVLFFGLRLSLQVYLYLQGEAGTLAWANTLLGWPVTILVLVGSYVYGIWRLRKLCGPSVEEFEEGKDPPWEGQKRGF
jgi:hypothetical protein